MDKNQDLITRDRHSKASANNSASKDVTFATEWESPPSIQFVKKEKEEVKEEDKDEQKVQISEVEETTDSASDVGQFSQLAPPELFTPTPVISAPIQKQEKSSEEAEEETSQMSHGLEIDSGDDPPPSDGGNNSSKGSANLTGLTSEGTSNMPGISSELQSKMEQNIGADLSNVKIHENSAKAKEVGALAYTQGSDIHFAPGQYNASSPKGQELIIHELTHVKQQRDGRVTPTTEVNGMPVNDSKELEQEADDAGRRFAGGAIKKNEYPTSTFNLRFPGGENHNTSELTGKDSSQLKSAFSNLFKIDLNSQSGEPLQFMPALPTMIYGAMQSAGNQPIGLAYEALSMVLDAELDHTISRDSIVSPLSPHHPNYYQGSGISLLHWYACWDFYKARWESSSNAERRSWVNKGISKIRTLILPRAYQLFEPTRRSEVRDLVRTEIRDRYRSVSQQRGSLVLHSIPETQVEPHGAEADSSETVRSETVSRGRIAARRTEEQQATDSAFAASAEGMIQSRTSDADEPGYRLIDDANSETESGRQYQASRLGTSAGQPASLGRGQLLTRLQVNRALGYFRSNPQIAALITQHSGLNQENLEEIMRCGQASLNWYNSITGSGGRDIPDQTANIRQMIAEGRQEQVVETYGEAFHAETLLPITDMQQMIDWQPMRSGGQRTELRALRSTLLRMRRRLKTPAVMRRFRVLRRSTSMNDREATIAVLIEVEGGDAQADGTPAPPREGLGQIISYLRNNSSTTILNISGRSATNQMLVEIYGQSHPNIQRLLEAHSGDRNQLDANDIQAYATRPINAEDKNGWFTRGAMQSQHWAAFEELLPSLDIYSTQARSLDNFDRALTTGSNIVGFEELDRHSRNIFLGQMARMSHGGAGRFDAMYRGDESLADYNLRLAEWESDQEGLSRRARRRYRRRHRRPTQRIRRRGQMSLFSGMNECRSVHDVRRLYQQIFAAEGSQLGTKIQTSLTRWTNNYLRLNDLNASEVDVFIPLEGARDLLPPPAGEGAEGDSTESTEESAEVAQPKMEKTSFLDQDSATDASPIQRAEIPANINIHENSSKATDLGAHAFAQGSDIHFAPGQFKPDTTAGQKLIGHELKHVEQQAKGVVSPTSQLKGENINNDKSLEDEADKAGEAFALNNETPSLDKVSFSGPIQREPIKKKDKVDEEADERRKKNDRELIDKALSGDTWDMNRVMYIRGIGMFSHATEKERLQIIGIVLDQYWVSDIDERLLSRIWQGWGEGVVVAITSNKEEYKKCIAVGMDPSDIQVLKKYFKKFESDVKGIAREYMQKNLQFALDEQIRLGLKQGEGPQSPTAEAEKQLFIQEMQVNAEQAVHIMEGMEKLRALHVGYTIMGYKDPYEKVPVKVHMKKTFNPQEKPGSRTAPGKEPAPHTWDAVNQHYTKATAALGALSATSPALYAAISEGKSAVQSLTAEDEGLLLREAGRLLQELEVNAEATLPKVDNGDLDWRDLVPIHQQLYMGTKQGASGVDWSQEAYKSVGQEIISDHETSEFWLELGLGTASAALFIVANVATGGLATAALLGGLAISGGVAIAAWENYEDLSTAADSGASKETELISDGQVNQAMIKAIIDTIFAFMDLAAPIAKIGKNALKMGKIGREAAERSVQTALKNLSEMSAEEAAQTIARAIDELGIDGARKASGSSLDQLESIIKRGGLEAAEESRLITQIKEFRLRGESANLGKILTKGCNAEETAWLANKGLESACTNMLAAVNRGEISKVLADKILVEAIDRVGPLKALDMAGGWEKASRALGAGSPAGDKLLSFRKSLSDDVMEYVRDKLGGDITATGTVKDFTNDLDMSLSGVKAAEDKFAAQAYLAKKLGVSNEPAALNHLFMIELFTDARRMTAHDLLPEAMRREVAELQAVKQKQLLYNSRLYYAKHADDQILTDSIKKQMVEAGVKEFPYKPLSENQVHILYMETDKLWQQLNDLVKAGKNAEAKEIAIKLGDTQALINATEEGGYFSAGGTRRWVTERPKAGKPRSPDLRPEIPLEQVNSIIDQLPKLDHSLAQLKHPDELIQGIRGIAKYGGRIFEVAGEINPAMVAKFDEIIKRCAKFKKAADKGSTELIGDSPQAIIKETEALFREIDTKTAEILDLLKRSIDEPDVGRGAAAAMQKAATNRVTVLSAKDAVLNILVLFSRAIHLGKPWSEVDPDLPPPVSEPDGNNAQEGDVVAQPSIDGVKGETPADVSAVIPSFVNIHKDSEQATQMGAAAFAQGSEIHFAPGQFQPDSSEGQKLIGHEIKHVEQQAQGRVQPNKEINGMPVNDNMGLEKEADEAGAKFAKGQNLESSKNVSPGASNILQRKIGVIQRVPDPEKEETEETETPTLADEMKTYGIKTKKHKQKNLSKLQGKLLETMLENCGIEAYEKEPKKWFDEFVTFSLFGRTCKGIRPEFAVLLKKGEEKTVEALKSTNPEVTDAKSAGEFMGINEGYKTNREFKDHKLEYLSMHLFGLAIDINYLKNPWLWGTGKYNDKPVFEYINRMNSLLGKDLLAKKGDLGTNPDTDVVHDDKGKLDDGKQMGEIYDDFHGVDKSYEAYFKLLDAGEEQNLKDLLAANESETWKGKTFEKAKEQIAADLKSLKSKAGRTTNNKGEGKGKDFHTEGIMDLNKNLVVSMAKVGIDWGGKYGDMMHFDMRFTGIGNKIHKTKRNDKVEAAKIEVTKLSAPFSEITSAKKALDKARKRYEKKKKDARLTALRSTLTTAETIHAKANPGDLEDYQKTSFDEAKVELKTAIDSAKAVEQLATSGTTPTVQPKMVVNTASKGITASSQKPIQRFTNSSSKSGHLDIERTGSFKVADSTRSSDLKHSAAQFKLESDSQQMVLGHNIDKITQFREVTGKGSQQANGNTSIGNPILGNEIDYSKAFAASRESGREKQDQTDSQDKSPFQLKPNNPKNSGPTEDLQDGFSVSTSHDKSFAENRSEKEKPIGD